MPKNFKMPYESRGSISPTYEDVQRVQVSEQQKRADIERLKMECEAKGGFWDGKQCILDLSKIPPEALKKGLERETPQAQPEQQKPTQAALTTPEVFKDEQGNLTGIRFPDGKTFLDLKPREVTELMQNYQQKTTIPEGAQPAGTAQAQMEMQQRNAQLMQMAQQGLITPQELQAIQGANPNLGTAVGAGAVGVIPGLIGGATAGAVGLGVPSAGALTIPGAIGGAALGAIGGFLVGVRSSIKNQQTDEFAKDRLALTKGERYLKSLITDTNKNPQNAPENIALFYKTLNMIDAAHAKTWADSQEDLNKWLGKDGSLELERFEVFDTTMRQYYISQFETSLAKPNPNINLISPEDLEIDIENE